MRIVIVIISMAALALAAALGGLGPAYRFELIDLGQAFSIMKMIALPTLVAAGLAAVAFVVSLFGARGLSVLALVAALAAGAAGYAPLKMRTLAAANPFIHDITTDFENPPEIVAAANLPRKNPPQYVGAELVKGTENTVADAQRAAFPDIGPLTVAADVEASAASARKVLAAMKMEVLADAALSDGAGRCIEAVYESLWYGFKDDFVVRLTPSERGTRIDVRSKSRVGGSDLGANAARVRKFMAAMDAAL
ncbi:MAG: DUF1499 domain-containing protein [Parvularculaceae bacterium]